MKVQEKMKIGIFQPNINHYSSIDSKLTKLEAILKQNDLDLLVFAGWNIIVTPEFINSYKKIINLHPALSNSFVGMNCVRKAYDAYQRGEIKYTGSMVHEVSEELDRGKVLQEVNVPIYENDSLGILEVYYKDELLDKYNFNDFKDEIYPNKQLYNEIQE